MAALISFLPHPEPLSENGAPDDATWLSGSHFSGAVARRIDAAGKEWLHVFFRGPVDAPGVGHGVGQIRLATAGRTKAEILDRGAWTPVHLTTAQGPAVHASDFGETLDTRLGGLNVTAEGPDTLHLYYKIRRQASRDTVVMPWPDRIDARGAVYDLPWPVLLPRDLIVQTPNGRLDLGRDYRVAHTTYWSGQGTPPEQRPAQLLLPRGDPGVTLDIAWRPKIYRGRSTSTDGGATFDRHAVMSWADGRQTSMDGCSVQTVDGVYAMALKVDQEVVIATSQDNLVWTGPGLESTIVAETHGTWYDDCIIGTNLAVSDSHYYLYLTGGSEAIIRSSGAPVFDYPTAVGLWRCARAADPRLGANWEAYGQNPVMLRGPTMSEYGGAIWQFNAVPVRASAARRPFHLGVFEAAGFIEGESDEVAEDLRDYQYGGGRVVWNVDAVSQTFAAVYDAPDFESAWDLDPAPPGTYRLRNVATERYLGWGESSLSPRLSSAPQPWTLGQLPSGFWLLLGALHTPLAVTERDGRGPVDFAGIGVEPPVPEAAEWTAYMRQDGAVRLQNRWSGEMLTASHTDSSVRAQSQGDSRTQLWVLEPM